MARTEPKEPEARFGPVLNGSSAGPNRLEQVSSATDVLLLVLSWKRREPFEWTVAICTASLFDACDNSISCALWVRLTFSRDLKHKLSSLIWETQYFEMTKDFLPTR